MVASILPSPLFLSTPSARRATTVPSSETTSVEDFYPRPPRGGRHLKPLKEDGLEHFYPRPPRGGRRIGAVTGNEYEHFYPRPPRGGRPTMQQLDNVLWAISIHALREEGDMPILRACLVRCLFLSTPSARRATSSRLMRSPSTSYFYPRPPRGGRPCPFLGLRKIRISIHALREEGDCIPERV